jgi:hypothetical protein
MGSFAFTCTVSGLPIEAGDPVRYLLLTKNPFHENAAAWSCEIDGHWYVRSFPFRAVYNDYGSIEPDQLGQPYLTDLMLEGLNADMIERGVGDNACHDVPVRRGMGLPEILNALWEARVLVPSIGGYKLMPRLAKKLGVDDPSKVYPEKPKRSKRKIHPGIPTMQRVRKAIEESGLVLTDEAFSKGFTVGRMFLGYIRVRSEKYGNEVEELTKLQAVLDQQGRFATVITVGTGMYSSQAELLVLPKPCTDGKGYGASFSPSQGYLGTVSPVAQAMIRNDVWEAICGMTLNSDYRGLPSTAGRFKDLAKDLWDKCLEHERFMRAPVEKDQMSDKYIRSMEFRELLQNDNVVASHMKGRAGTGLREHFDLMVGKGLDGKLTPEVVTDFLATVGETVFVQMILSNVRYQWEPSSGNGPQFGEWAMHLDYLTRLQAVTSGIYAKKREEYDGP